MSTNTDAKHITNDEGQEKEEDQVNEEFINLAMEGIRNNEEFEMNVRGVTPNNAFSCTSKHERTDPKCIFTPRKMDGSRCVTFQRK